MGIFDDKKFDSLDWISQAVEPVETDLMGAFGQIPDVVEIDFELYQAMIGDSWSMDLSIDHALRFLITKHAQRTLSFKECEVLKGSLEFVINNGTEIDYETRTIRGDFRIVKKEQVVNEKDLLSLVGHEGIQHIENLRYSNFNISRMNEVLEMVGKISDAEMRSRSHRAKVVTLRNRLRDIFNNDEWRIRTPELGRKIGVWIHQYVTSGNLAAWSNFCRLKLMTHNERAIYSIQEAE